MITSVGLTRDEALREVKAIQKDRDNVVEVQDGEESNVLYKISNLDEADYRHEIGWFSYEVISKDNQGEIELDENGNVVKTFTDISALGGFSISILSVADGSDYTQYSDINFQKV